ncbi:hypothetical protein ACQJBY_023656 [Aegilops geniculata]
MLNVGLYVHILTEPVIRVEAELCWGASHGRVCEHGIEEGILVHARWREHSIELDHAGNVMGHVLVCERLDDELTANWRRLLIMPEDKFHKLADDTIHDLLEKLEEYGDSQQMDGFDIDYGNQVLTLRLGDLGTYVVNKQTPNRQIWLSSPVSGPARFDWDAATDSWVYRRTGVNLMRLLEKEIGELCGTPVDLS